MEKFHTYLKLFDLFFALFTIHSFPDLSPCMRIKQATLAHSPTHFSESGHRYRITQLIRFKVRTHRWIEETDKGPLASFAVFKSGLCHYGTATGTE